MAERKLTVTIAGKADDLHRTLDKTHSKLSGFASGIGDVAKKAALGLAGIGAVATGFAVSSIKAASDLSESMGKASVVFGEQSKEVEKWAANSAKAFGQSKQQALEAAGTYGNLFQAFGLGREESTKMSTSLVELAADLASFNNTSVDEAIVALRSGLSGETEPLKRYGVAINSARLSAEALRMGLVKAPVDMLKVSEAEIKVTKATEAYNLSLKRNGMQSDKTRDAALVLAKAQQKLEDVLEGGKVELNEAEKAAAAYSLIMKDTKLAQGDFARTSGGLANQQRILAAQFTNLRAEIGAKLLPVAVNIATFLTGTLIPAFEKWWPIIAEKLEPKLKALGDVAMVVFGWLKEHVPPMLERIGEFIKTHVIPRVSDLVGWIKEDLKPAFERFIELIETKVVPFIKEELLPALKKIGDWIKEHVQPKIEWFIKEVDKTLIPLLVNLVGWFDEKLLPKLESFATAVKAAGDKMIETFKFVGKAADEWLGPVDEWLSKAGKVASLIADPLGLGRSKTESGILAKKLAANVPAQDPFNVHTGGTFHARRPGGVGLALLRDGERVSVPGMGGSGGVTIVVQGSVITERELVDVMARARARGVRGI